ncbi:MAG: hypothetical protein A9Z00_06590 [Thermobacillus sp. ZCTH02-B1]|uniref:DUF58 domain-containing protein n=1 Tax=Thermobacillus sp. ZCTH02-B1 TaxID=1858795 RepID=UPI000B5726B3|nr:DUF58 domain-containing protein [Thermobacillus sp. ZCTH02-B1]OUM96018.1 MAG: hypothetical protein A9Z00_06590 [Thermobacillus sp. ZCTH02-B1]
MPAAKTLTVRWRMIAAVYVCCTLYLLFQGGKTAVMLFVILNALILYLALGKLSGIGRVRGERRLGGDPFPHHHVLTAGSRLDVELHLRIPGFWPIPYVLVQDTLERIGGRPMMFEVSFIPDFRRSGAVSYSTPPLPRGRYVFRKTECVTRDIFGLFEHRGAVDAHHRFTVLPQTIPIREWNRVERGLKGPYAHAVSHRHAKETTQINGVREYIYGDRLSRIHWNATAKTGQWKSKEFDRESVPRTVIVLDRCGTAYGSADRFELAVSIAASLVEYGIRREMAIGLVSTGAKVEGFLPRSIADQRRLILNHLVDVQADGAAGLYRSLHQSSALIPGGSFVVLVTPHDGEEVIRTMEWLERNGNTPCLIHLPGDRNLSDVRGWQRLLTVRGWPVYNVRTLAELPAALEGGGR